MNFGLQIFDPAENIVFDSNVAAGGVCLGHFYVPLAGAVFTFPEMAGNWTGFAVSPVGQNVAGMTYDNLLGHPRFTFRQIPWERVVALFVK